MREARDTDFFIELPDVGVFRFGRRTFGDRMRIRAEYLRLVRELGDDDEDLAFYAAIISVHSVLCVEAPEGWEDIAQLDLTGPGNVDEKIFALSQRLRAKEDSFRKGATKSGEGESEGTA